MVILSAAFIARLHTILAASAFLSALIVGSALHYKKIVKNGVAEYPDEWFPSVSATCGIAGALFTNVCGSYLILNRVGDWYPERNIFQLLIAITSGGAFALFLRVTYLMVESRSSFLACTVSILSSPVSFFCTPDRRPLFRHSKSSFMRRLGLRHFHRRPRRS